MKPTLQTVDNDRRPYADSRRFPITDFNYQSVGIRGHISCCAGTTPASLRNISRDYFDGEARHDFLVDAFLFGSMSLTVAVPLLSAALAVLDLIRTVSSI